MTLALSILLAIVAIATIAIVAIQPSKGEGLGSIGGGAQMFFNRNKGVEALLDRATWWLGAAIMVLSLVLILLER